MATKDYLQTLLQLDKSLPQFSKQLCDILSEVGFDEYIQNLSPQSDSIVRVIVYLDQVPSPHCFRLSFTEPIAGPG